MSGIEAIVTGSSKSSGWLVEEYLHGKEANWIFTGKLKLLNLFA
jgi:hypothetical protein